MRLSSSRLTRGTRARGSLTKPIAIQAVPAAHPVSTASPIEGWGPRKIANISAAISDRRNPSPKMNTGLCGRRCSGRRGCVCHASPKSSGAYQIPPAANAAIAATSTAARLIPAIALILICGRLARARGAAGHDPARHSRGHRRGTSSGVALEIAEIGPQLTHRAVEIGDVTVRARLHYAALHRRQHELGELASVATFG